jgi:hypothetical protein
VVNVKLVCGLIHISSESDPELTGQIIAGQINLGESIFIRVIAIHPCFYRSPIHMVNAYLRGDKIEIAVLSRPIPCPLMKVKLGSS